MRIALISNPGSGSAGEADVPALLGELGAEVERFAIEDAERAGAAGADRIVVAGGDGSVAPAAAAAARGGIELAVIPAGTANDFAERIGLPQEIEEAAQLAASGERTRPIDLARVAKRPFVNVASLGLAPAAASAAEELKETLGALAYTVGALRAATVEEPVRCRVECEGGELFAGEAWQVIVGCTGAFGGGARIEADADDGRLDVVVIEGGPRRELARRAVALRSGGIEDQDGVRSGRGSGIAIELEAEQELNIDGEVVSSAELGDGRLQLGADAQAVRLVIG